MKEERKIAMIMIPLMNKYVYIYIPEIPIKRNDVMRLIGFRYFARAHTGRYDFRSNF